MANESRNRESKKSPPPNLQLQADWPDLDPGKSSLLTHSPSEGFVVNDGDVLTASEVLTVVHIPEPANGFVDDYLTHEDAKIRNLSLLDTIRNELGGDSFPVFKTAVNSFRQGIISAGDFVTAVAELPINFNSFYEQVLVMLPNIRKQNELYHAYAFTQTGNLYTCERCFQVRIHFNNSVIKLLIFFK